MCFLSNLKKKRKRKKEIGNRMNRRKRVVCGICQEGEREGWWFVILLNPGSTVSHTNTICHHLHRSQLPNWAAGYWRAPGGCWRGSLCQWGGYARGLCTNRRGVRVCVGVGGECYWFGIGSNPMCAQWGGCWGRRGRARHGDAVTHGCLPVHLDCGSHFFTFTEK